MSNASLSRSGFDALREGRFEAARQAFAELQAAGGADADDLVGLALACARCRDAAAALQAVDAALALRPTGAGRLRALLLRADLLAAGPDEREAAAAYQLVLKLQPDPAGLPPALLRDWQRAQAAVQHYAQRFAAQLEQRLDAALAQAREAQGPWATRRFEQALRLLQGKQALYRSAPRLFHLPELPERAFFDPADFPWVPALQAQTAAIRDELRELLRERDARFRPYVERAPGRAVAEEGGMLDNPDWTACYLWKNGAAVTEVQQRCPRTVAALARLPLATVPGRAPNVLFSLLRPGAHIPPHHGFLNTRCIVHLPLIVPASTPPCRLRVGAETHAWREGELVIFDDSFEHEAWNPSSELRVVLLFEVWRPELSELERELVVRLFDALGPAVAETAL